MTLTPDEAKNAMRIAIQGMLANLETGEVSTSAFGGMLQSVTAIPAENPHVFAAGYFFVSENQDQLISLREEISKLFVGGV